MSQAEFNYEGTILNIQCNPEEKMEDIINRFTAKIGKKKEEVYFIYSGGIIKEELTYNTQINENDRKRNKMSIWVNNKTNDDEEDDESLRKSQFIICPNCKESARILIANFLIEIYECKNGHITKNILIKDFEQTQNINEAKILCQNCHKVNKSTSYNNTFFICLECKQNLCQLCKSIHDKSHNLIDYDDKFFTCDLHYESYISYCMDCKKDICLACEIDHSEHKIISYSTLLPNVKKIKEEKSILSGKIEEFKNEVKSLINKLNNLIDSFNDYFRIYEDILNSYGNKRINYFLLKNIQDMSKFNNDFIQNINKILNEKDNTIRTINIIDIYNKMNYSYNDDSNKVNDASDKKNQININVIKENNNNIINNNQDDLSNLAKEKVKSEKESIIEEVKDFNEKGKKVDKNINEKKILNSNEIKNVIKNKTDEKFKMIINHRTYLKILKLLITIIIMILK